eukprot:11778097-Ditylum_brightwellii.AAC.1
MCSGDIWMLLVSRPDRWPSLSTIILGRYATSTRTAEQHRRVQGPTLVDVVLRRSTVLGIITICVRGRFSC